MVKRKNTIGILGFFIANLFFVNSNAQIETINSQKSNLSCIEVGLTGGVGQYRGDYHAFTRALSDLDYKFAYGISARYNFNTEHMENTLHDIFDRRLSFLLEFKKMKASSNKKDFSEVMNMDILEFGAMLQFNILKYSTMKNKIKGGFAFTPYIETGFAFTGFKCDNFTDKNLLIADRYADKNYNFLPVGILGWGVKLNIVQGITLGLDGSYRFCFTDDIDHLVGVTQRNDQYYFVGAEIMFNLGEIFGNK